MYFSDHRLFPELGELRFTAEPEKKKVNGELRVISANLSLVSTHPSTHPFSGDLFHTRPGAAGFFSKG